MRNADATPRRIDQPQPGLFRLRLTRRGWEVAARIIHHPDGTWQAVVDGIEHPANADPFAAPWVSRVWEGGRESDEADYAWRLAVKAWAEVHDPDHPACHPTEPIKPGLLKPIIPTKDATA